MTSKKIYCSDGMHGGVAVLMCNVDKVVEALMKKHDMNASYKFYLELDGFTFEDWLRSPSPIREELKRALREGWAEIVNGAYTQPFAENIGLESNIRQLQWGKLLAKKALGIDIETYLVQEHAFHVALPQILLQLGYKYVILRTHWPIWGQHRSYPFESFYWRGADGSRILTIPHYSFLHFGRVPEQRPQLESWIGEGTGPPREENIERWLSECERMGINRPLATREPDLILPAILKDDAIRCISEDPKLQFVTPKEYAEMVKADAEKEVYIHPDDMDTTLPFGLNGDKIIIGTKRIENKLLTAEKFSTIAYLLNGRAFCDPYRMNIGGGQHFKYELESAWRKLLLSEQHDIWVCGPLASLGYTLWDRGMEWLREAEDTCNEVLNESLSQIMFHVKFDLSFEKAAPIAVFNPLPWRRSEAVNVNLKFKMGDFKSIAIIDPKGRRVPSQVLEVERYEDGSIAWASVAFMAFDVPGMGYKVFYVTDEETVSSTDLEASEYKAANSKVIVTLDNRGITGITLADTGQQLIADGKVAARLRAFVGDKKLWIDTSEATSTIRMMEKGPVLARYEIKGSTEAFDFQKIITVYSYTPWIEVVDCINMSKPAYIGYHSEVKGSFKDWRGYLDVFMEEEKLRVVIPLSVAGETVRRNIVYVPSETRRSVFSAYDWTDVSDENKGLTLINRGNFRYHYNSALKELSLILGYSGNFIYSRGPEFHMMKGKYTFSYALYPHGSFDVSQVNRAALAVNNPLMARSFKYSPVITKSTSKRIRRHYVDSEKHGKTLLPQEFSFLKIDAENINVSTLRLEDNKPILRLYEHSGRGGNVRISFFKKIREASIVNLKNEEMQPIGAADGTLNIKLNPYQIITLRLEID